MSHRNLRISFPTCSRRRPFSDVISRRCPSFLSVRLSLLGVLPACSVGASPLQIHLRHCSTEPLRALFSIITALLCSALCVTIHVLSSLFLGPNASYRHWVASSAGGFILGFRLLARVGLPRFWLFVGGLHPAVYDVSWWWL